ncbi:hypothetical protein [Pandoraea sp. NPDC087047]|uniref:hypothetical protein n=1 Tax=Pandoraea sp. NPDC087047 TaxID=3364390 RepID=UPI0037FFA321
MSTASSVIARTSSSAKGRATAGAIRRPHPPRLPSGWERRTRADDVKVADVADADDAEDAEDAEDDDDAAYEANEGEEGDERDEVDEGNEGEALACSASLGVAAVT